MPIEARLQDGCTAPRRAPPAFEGRAWIDAWVSTCPDGIAGGVIAIEGLERTATEVLVRYETEPRRAHVHRLTGSETSFEVPMDAGSLEILASYTGLGVTHILGGVDHLLFVLALLLLVPDRRRLIWAITAFTVADSITLAAASLGWVHIPTAPVEAMIALSIVFLVYELTLPSERRDELALRFRQTIAQTRGSPLFQAMSVRTSASPSIRSVFARRCRRDTAIEAGSTTWLSIPSATSARWIQNPSSPASWITITGTTWPVRRRTVRCRSETCSSRAGRSPPRT